MNPERESPVVLSYATPRPRDRPKAADLMLLKCLGTCHVLLGLALLPSGLSNGHNQPVLTASMQVCGVMSIASGVAMCGRRYRWLAIAGCAPNLVLFPCVTLFAAFSLAMLLIPSVGRCFSRPSPTGPCGERRA